MRIWTSRATLALVVISFTTLLFVAARKNGWIGSSSPDPARHAAPEPVAAATEPGPAEVPADAPPEAEAADANFGQANFGQANFGQLGEPAETNRITPPKRIPPKRIPTEGGPATVPEEEPDRSPEGRLVTAAFLGDADAVAALLGEGVSPDARNRKGRGALHRAAEAGAPQTLDLLLGAGADPNAPDGNGMTPLMAAAFGGSFAAGSRLLAAGATVNARHEPHRVTALEQVLAGWRRGAGGSAPDSPLDDDRRRFVEALFRAGADPNLGGAFGPPLRFLPHFHTDEELVALFFDNGARLDDLPQLRVFERLPGRVGEYVRDAVRAAEERAASR